MNFRANISVLFGYAARRGHARQQIQCARDQQPKLVDKAPEIFSVDELAALLHTALSNAPDVVPMLVIGAFAGLREAEIKRLDWAEIDQRRGFVEVKASKAKTARRRIVRDAAESSPTGLGHMQGMTGAVVPVNARKKLDAFARSLDWRSGRRTACATALRAIVWQRLTTLQRVAAELGHTTRKMLYSTYRELVLPEEAQRYWQIVPATGADNVIAWEAAAK